LLVRGWSHGEVLALNAVLYVGCFALSLAYALPWRGGAQYGAATTGLACLLILTGLLGAYTLLVLMVERSARHQ
jgi:hypothetical protein